MIEEKHAVGLAVNISHGYIDVEPVLESFMNPKNTQVTEEILNIWSDYDNLTRHVFKRIIDLYKNRIELERIYEKNSIIDVIKYKLFQLRIVIRNLFNE